MGSKSYSIGEIHIFLKRIITAWEANKLTTAAIHALLKFIYLYLDQTKIPINFKNQTPFPICHFAPNLPLSASILYSYLKTLSFDVLLFQLNKTDSHLKVFIEKKNPLIIIFTISHFLHLDTLKKLVPYLHKRNLKIFIGGIPFVYDKSLKSEFPECNFPKDIAELAQLLNNFIKEGHILAK
ncbi:MAG: hypothetical protein ACFFDN_31340 [Candidatus Hodarchaeota archaeon]